MGEGGVGCEPLVFVHFILCQSELCAHRRFWFTTFTSHSCSDCWSGCTRQTCPSRKINYSHSRSSIHRWRTAIRSSLGLSVLPKDTLTCGPKGIEPLTFQLVVDLLCLLSQAVTCLIVIRGENGVQRAPLGSNHKIQRGLLSRVVISLFTEHCKNSASALCQEKAVFSPLHVFEKGQKLINCRIAPLTKDRLFVVLFVTSKRDSFSVAASFITSHFSAKWNGQTALISRKFTRRQGVLYFHEQGELHITWNLWACVIWHLCIAHHVPWSTAGCGPLRLRENPPLPCPVTESGLLAWLWLAESLRAIFIWAKRL